MRCGDGIVWLTCVSSGDNTSCTDTGYWEYNTLRSSQIALYRFCCVVPFALEMEEVDI